MHLKLKYLVHTMYITFWNGIHLKNFIFNNFHILGFFGPYAPPRWKIIKIYFSKNFDLPRLIRINKIIVMRAILNFKKNQNVQKLLKIVSFEQKPAKMDPLLSNLAHPTSKNEFSIKKHTNLPNFVEFRSVTHLLHLSPGLQ